MKINKNFVLILSSFFLLASCKTGLLADPKNKTADTAAGKTRHELIKEEKRKQSEADLPFRVIDPTKKINVIAFSSSVDQSLPQPVWTTIAKENPDLFIFTGDHLSISKPEQKNVLEQYKRLNRSAEYRDIREKIPFMAVWEDHDNGNYDANAVVIDTEASKSEYLKYWSYLKTSLPKQAKYLYHSKIMGDKKNTVQVIVLDTRSERSELKKNLDPAKPIENITTTVTSTDQTTATTTTETKTVTIKERRPYLADDDKKKHFLSEDQWSWLESELRKQVGLKIIVSSIQVLANDHQSEKWGNFPHERERFLNLLKSTKVHNVLILSGNRQLGTLAQLDVKGLGKVVDATAGPINLPGLPGNIVKDATYLKDAYSEVNFGLIKINWSTRKAAVEIHGTDNSVVNSTELKF